MHYKYFQRTKKMKEGRTHDIVECKVEYSDLKTRAIKTDIFDVSQDAPQRISPNDNFIELLIQNLIPGSVYSINGIYVKTKYSNWSDSMQMDKNQVSLSSNQCFLTVKLMSLSSIRIGSISLH